MMDEARTFAPAGGDEYQEVEANPALLAPERLVDVLSRNMVRMLNAQLIAVRPDLGRGVHPDLLGFTGEGRPLVVMVEGDQDDRTFERTVSVMNHAARLGDALRTLPGLPSGPAGHLDRPSEVQLVYLAPRFSAARADALRSPFWSATLLHYTRQEGERLCLIPVADAADPGPAPHAAPVPTKQLPLLNAGPSRAEAPDPGPLPLPVTPHDSVRALMSNPELNARAATLTVPPALGRTLESDIHPNAARVLQAMMEITHKLRPDMPSVLFDYHYTATNKNGPGVVKRADGRTVAFMHLRGKVIARWNDPDSIDDKSVRNFELLDKPAGGGLGGYGRSLYSIKVNQAEEDLIADLELFERLMKRYLAC